MTNKHMKKFAQHRCSLRKPQWDIILYPPGCLQRLTTLKIDEDVKQQELSYFIGGGKK